MSSDELSAAKATNAALQVIPLNHHFWLYQYPVAEPLPLAIQGKLFQTNALNVGSTVSADDKQSGKGFCTISRTEEEWSIMIQEDDLDDSAVVPDGVEREGPWGCLKVRGPMVLTLKGIAADLTTVLAQAEIPVFLISTWNTDYIFVKADLLEKAGEAVKTGGWKVI